MADTPAGWVTQPPKTGKVDSQVTTESPDTIAWWDSFNDAELSSLIKRAHDSNPDLRLAALLDGGEEVENADDEHQRGVLE